MKNLLDGLVASTRAGPQTAATVLTQRAAMATKGAMTRPASHDRAPGRPTHPETGRKGLYVSPAFTLGSRGDRTETKPLLGYLYRARRLRGTPAASAGARAPSPSGTTAASGTTPCTTTAGTAGVMRRITIRGERPR